MKNRGKYKDDIFYYSIVHPAFYDSEWIEDETHFKYAKIISNYIKPYQFKNTFGVKQHIFTVLYPIT